MAGLVEDCFIVRKSRQKLVRRAPVSNRVHGRQALAMLLHLLFTEQL
jgi:hypothetical protein